MALVKGIHHVAFATDDVDACVPARMAFGFGPLGEEVEFFQEK